MGGWGGGGGGGVGDNLIVSCVNGHHVHIVVSSYTFTLPQPTSRQLCKVARRKFKANVRAGILVSFYLEN